MTTITNKTATPQVKDNVRQWFEDLIENLRIHQVSLETNTATKEREDFYKTLMEGSETDINSLSRTQSSMHFIKRVVIDYFDELYKYNKKPLKLALDFSDAKVLVWAEVTDEDEEAEDALLLTEAKVNAKFFSHGFHVSSTIVEKSDNVPVPPHYNKFL